MTRASCDHKLKIDTVIVAFHFRGHACSAIRSKLWARGRLQPLGLISGYYFSDLGSLKKACSSFRPTISHGSGVSQLLHPVAEVFWYRQTGSSVAAEMCKLELVELTLGKDLYQVLARIGVQVSSSA
jgi:hypothetical protein